MNGNKKILMAGLPEAGKTTFVAALWNYLNNVSDDKAFSIGTLANNDIEYLNNISGKWASYDVVGRNTGDLSSVQNIKMNLLRTGGGEVTLEVPDIAGEFFRDLFEQRQWPLEYDTLLSEITGVILFIRSSDENNTPKLIKQVQNLTQVAGETETPVQDDQNNMQQWNHNLTSSQIKLVEFLQFITYHKTSILPIKVSVVISQWDVIMKTLPDYTPEKWLAHHLPLLNQYLCCNTDTFNSGYFGVSAQGGSYKDDIDELLSKNPMDRIMVKEGQSISNDITKPIVWITG
ncbi:MAG: hypothetical protein V4620_03305 [Bacteroidota bacterium]